MSNDTLGVDSTEDAELSTPETIGTDDEASQETTESSTEAVPKGKEKALRDTEAALKEKQAEFTRLSQQMAELKGNMDVMLQVQKSIQQPKQAEAKDWMEDFTDDALVENPALALKAMRKQREEFVAVLRDRDAWMQEQLSRIGGSQLDPELRSVVDGLKADPDFADLPEQKLVAMARKMAPKKAVMEPRGNIAGSGRSAPASKPKAGEMDPAVRAYLIAAGTLKSTKRDDTLE